MAIPDFRGLSEAAVVEYYGGKPRRALVIRRDGKHENDPEIGPLEVVKTSSFNLTKKISDENIEITTLSYF